MHKVILTIVAVCVAAGVAMAQRNVKKPEMKVYDPAYPEKMSTQALADLDKALATSDSRMVVDALMRYSAAQTSIDPANINGVIARMDSTLKLDRDPVAVAMIHLLKGNTLNYAYKSDRYAYDERQLPLTPLPADIMEWSGQQFREMIESEIAASLLAYPALSKVPIADYSPVVEADDLTRRYYPTIYDFVASQSLSILSNFDRGQYELGDKWLAPVDRFVTFDSSTLPGTMSRQVKIYRQLLRQHPADTPAGVMWDCARIGFVATHLAESSQAAAAYKRLATQLKGSEYAGIPILRFIEQYASSDYETSSDEGFRRREEALEALRIAEEYVKHYPDFFATNDIQNHINNMLQRTVTLSYPNVTTPQMPLPVTVRGVNATSVELKIYKVDLPQKSHINIPNRRATLVDRIDVSIAGPILERVDTVIQVPLTDYGSYAIVPAIGNEESQYAQVVSVSDMVISTATTPDSRIAYVVNPVSGQPVDKAAIMQLINLSKDERKHLGTTNQQGVYSIVDRRIDHSIYPVRGADKHSPAIFPGYSSGVDNRVNYRASIFTPLPIYHPGDSIEAVVILTATDLDGSRPAANRRVKVELRNPFYNLITTTVATTDAWGRATVQLLAPTSGNQGEYAIVAMSDAERDARQYGSTRVMVSDYKMPQVLVSVDTTEVRLNRPVVIRGKVTTYTGFPLADSKVNIALANIPLWRWWYAGGGNAPFYTTQTTTDAAGRYVVTIPTEALANAPQPDGLFRAEITATAPSGESQSTTTQFARLRQYRVSAQVPAAILATTPCQITAKVQGTSGNVDMPVILTLTRDGKTAGSFRLQSKSTIDFGDIPSGTYSYTVSLADPDLKSEGQQGEVTIYRDDDTASPCAELLWSPIANTLTADADRRATIAVECAVDSTYTLMLISTPERTVSREWRMLHAGMNHIDVILPKAERMARVTLLATRNLRTSSLSVSVLTPEAQNRVKLHITSMRDKVTPGADEMLTITLTNSDGTPATGALIADMWNKSLAVLAPFSMSLPTYTQSIPWGHNFAMSTANAYLSTNMRWLKTTALARPLFKAYAGPETRVHTTMRYKNAAVARTSGLVTEDAAEAEEMAMVSDSAPAMAGAAVENVIDEAGDGSEAVAKPELSPYRDIATPLAFFRPMLNTDADGRAVLTYTVPNANALWGLNIAAYTDRMLTASIDAEVIAAKPVMVDFNAPRFLRMGDRAQLRATVMNATDERRTVVTTVEFFSPSTGEIISTHDSQRTVAPGASATEPFTLEAPFSGPMIGYRILSTADNYTDGVRGMIPLLPSVEPIIESDNFYMQPDQLQITRELPSAGIDGTVTLQFCENPAWYVVAALPGLRSESTNTSNSAVSAIFSAAVADGLLKTNPRIKSMIHRWVMSDRSDSTLVSMLERNDDLKIALLEATPWMMDAAGDSERMARLALLFDHKEVRSAIDSNIAKLAKTQCKGGGWSWTPDYKQPSLWVTMNVLAQLGRLKQLNFLPNDPSLKKMIRNALTYIDRETAAKYRKYPDADYMYYTRVRDYFADIPQSTAAVRVTEATVQHIIADWREMDVTAKGVAAIILCDHGYQATARQVMKSVKEFATVTPQGGMWWPTLNSRYNQGYSKLASAAILLEALYTATPASDDIDLLRQWIVVQKQSQNWSDGVVTSELITSFLRSGTNWTVPPMGVTVEVNGQELVDKSPMAGTGEFRADLTPLLAKTPGALNITKPGDYPSWGALITRRKARLSTIEIQPCDGLSIEKKIYKVESTPNGESVTEATGLAVGDKVRVDLLIKADNDIDYVVMTDLRGACFEPVEQTPKPIYSQGICFYRENRDASTNLYIDRLPAGTYRLSYDLYVNSAGTYSCGTANIQSQYAPAITAHSAGALVTVMP